MTSLFTHFHVVKTFVIILLFANVHHCWNPFKDLMPDIFSNFFAHKHEVQKGNLLSRDGKIVPPLFMAHRGAKFLMPENTIPAFDLAMLFKTDYSETDLVVTKDHVLVCHHDITLKDSTDVANHSEFAHLRTKNITVSLNSTSITILDDWLVSDFTFAQLSTLRKSQEQVGWRPHHFDGQFRIPSFQEYLDAAHKDTWRRHKYARNKTGHFIMGIIPELKYPDYHNADIYKKENQMETELLSVLKTNGYLDNNCSYNKVEIPCSPLIVQCFHIETLNYLSQTAKLELMTLLEVDKYSLQYFTYGGFKVLQNVSAYVCLEKDTLYSGVEHMISSKNITYDKEEMKKLGGFVGPKDIVPYLHHLGIKIGIFSLYHSVEENTNMCDGKCEPEEARIKELEYYMDIGVDAIFAEGLTEALRIRDKWELKKNAGGREGGNLMGCPAIQQKVAPCLQGIK